MERFTIRAALTLGFGVTLGLWLLTGYQFSRRMATVERETASITERYRHAQDLLSSVRAQVLLASVYLRDALLDPRGDALESYRRQLDGTYDIIDRALEQYVPVLNATAEREHLARLRREIEDFRGTTRRLLTGGGIASAVDVRTLLNRDVMPRREAAVRVSEEVQTLNRAAFIHHQREIVQLHRDAQQQTWQRLGVALITGLGIALIATVYAGRLETRLRQQSLRDAMNSEYVQRLSSKLVTVQEEERRNIARDLHDEVGQALTAIKVELSVAERRINASGGAGELLDDAQAITDRALHSVRDLSHLLHPALLDDLGLPAAIEWHLRAFTARHGVNADLQQDNMAKRLAPEVEAAAYRIVQEALTNVAKHARAKACRVTLRRSGESLEISIVDDGLGFESVGVDQFGSRPGLGLVGMRERATQLNGAVTIDSVPGRGTTVRVTLPARPRVAPAVDGQDVEAGELGDLEILGG